MDWQPSDDAKGKELKISLLQGGGFYARRPADAIARRTGARTDSTQRRKDAKETTS
jgi:hypothetical protein